jgi:hypothetical protein
MMDGDLLRLSDLGFQLLILSYLPGFVLFREILRWNIPESLLSGGYGRVVAVKAVFAGLFSLMASSKPLGPVAPFVAVPVSLGPGYFIVSMLIDFFFIALLRKREYFGAFKIAVFNVLHIPFVTSVAVLYGVLWEQGRALRRVRRDLPTRGDGVLLGYAVKQIRTVQKPVRRLGDADIREPSDVRPLPRRVPVYYSPEIGVNDLNPHAIIAGASGAGKTTTLNSLVRGLARNYPVLLVDIKGDITRALLTDGVNAYIMPVAVSGLNPFAKMFEGERGGEGVEDLILAISVVEVVGSRQSHFIRAAYRELYYSGVPLTYTGLLNVVDRLARISLTAENRWGPGTRDALFSLASKLNDLAEYLRDDGAVLSRILGRVLVGEKSEYPIVVFNLEGINENLRAIVLELILRKLGRYLSRRGPTAYLTEKPVVLVVDEAYLVTKPMERYGRRGDESRSILETMARAGRSYGLALILVTQRLSDIVDGIRQNCEKWIVFNTTSPEDAKVLQISGEFLPKIVSLLQKGHAYIRILGEGKLDNIRYTSDFYVVTEGYIFEIERKLLGPEKSGKEGRPPTLHRPFTICYRCMLLTRDIEYCHYCNMPPLLEKKEIENVDGGRRENQAQLEDQGIDYELVLRRTLEKKPGLARYLRNINQQHVERLLRKYLPPKNNSNIDQELVAIGLLKYSPRDGRERLRPAGKALIETFLELYGSSWVRPHDSQQ